MEEGESNTIFVPEERVTTFRLNQVSDLHFSAIVGRLNGLDAANSLRAQTDAILLELFKAGGSVRRAFYPSTFSADVALSLLRHLAEDIPRCDALVVTGDLATTGSRDDLLIARAYFSGQIPPNWNPGIEFPSLLGDDSIVVALPGNHDRYEGIMLSPAGTGFETHFGPAWDFGMGRSYDLNSTTGSSRVKVCTLLKDAVGLGIVLADFSLPDAHAAEGMSGWIGQGSAQCIDELVSATHMIRSEAEEGGVDAAVIWALHFPPNFPKIDPRLKLLYEDDLIAAAEQLRVPLILAGHTHLPLRYQSGINNPVTVICCGASTGVSAHNEYSCSQIEIDIGRGGEVTDIRAINLMWDQGAMSFVAQSTYPLHP